MVGMITNISDRPVFRFGSLRTIFALKKLLKYQRWYVW